MDVRCAQISDFDKLYFYKYVMEKTQEIGKYVRWVYGQHPTDAMILNYIEQLVRTWRCSGWIKNVGANTKKCASMYI